MKEKKTRIRVQVTALVKKALEKRAAEGFRSLHNEIVMILSRATAKKEV